MPKDSSPFLKDDPEIRIAEKVYEKPHWLVGHRTQIGLALAAIGMLGNWAGFKLPQNEINSFLDLLAANWDGLAQLAGGAIAIYGNIAKSIREKKLKKAVVVKAVIAEQAVEKLSAVKTELVDTKAELREIKTELKKATG